MWGVVMDTGLADDGWHSLVVLADGTTSLYTSAAFGIIGAGTHEQVRLASDALLASTEQRLSSFTALPRYLKCSGRAQRLSGRSAVRTHSLTSRSTGQIQPESVNELVTQNSLPLDGDA